jgi:hypothetical protein
MAPKGWMGLMVPKEEKKIERPKRAKKKPE